MADKPVRVGYILRKFPVLSETFILNEILALEQVGIDVHIFSVDRPNDPKFHKDLHRLKSHVTYIPDILHMGLLWKGRKSAAKKFGGSFTESLVYTMRHLNPSLGLRFLQSCFVALEAKKRGIEHFHAHFATRATTVAFLSSKIAKIPYSFTAHAVDIFKESICRKALRKKLEASKFVVAVSEYNKDFLEGLVENGQDKIVKIHNGIDLSVFQPGPGIADGHFTFLCVARFIEKKGHRILVEACHLLKKRRKEFRCLLVGQGTLQESMEKLVTARGLEDKIIFLGPRTHEEVLSLFHCSHVFVLPCRMGSDGNRDGLPVSIVEALACGLPVVTTPMTGNPEAVNDGHNGFLVPFDDPLATANAMCALMEDPSLYARISRNAASSVAQTFDIKRTTRQLADMFMGGGR